MRANTATTASPSPEIAEDNQSPTHWSYVDPGEGRAIFNDPGGNAEAEWANPAAGPPPAGPPGGAAQSWK